jgi:hypothetical protein
MLDEREGDPVHPEAQGEVEIGPVLVRHGRGGDRDSRHGQALVVGQALAGGNLRFGEAGTTIADRQADLAVVQQHLHARTQDAQHLGMRQGRARRVARRRIGVEAQPLTRLQGDSSALEPAHPELGPLEVSKGGEGATDLRLRGAHRFERARVLIMLAVAEVEAKDIHPRPRQLQHALG